MKTPHLFIGICIVSVLAGFEAVAAETDGSFADSTFYVIPAFFYSTDTGFVAGVAGIKSYHAHLPRISTLQFSTLLTTRRQFTTSFKVEHFLRGGDDRLNVSAGYRKYPTDFFGIGNRTVNDDPEQYTPELFEFKCFYELKFRRFLKLRSSFFLINQAIIKKEHGRMIESGAVAYSRGRFDAGPGIGLVWDSRDNTLAATRGLFVALEYTGIFLQNEGGAYNSTTLDVRAFWNPVSDLVFGSMLLLEDKRGDVPFYLLPHLGGQDLLRGYKDNRFLDRSLFLLQQDIRFPVWRFIGGAVFGAAGQVAPEFGRVFSGKFHAAWGIGARVYLNREERLFIRADVARGEDADGFYITFGEAF